MLNTENLKIATAKTTQQATDPQPYLAIADSSVGKTHKHNALNAIVLMSQPIFSTVRVSKLLLLSYAMTGLQFRYVLADPKVGEQSI